MKFIDEVQIEVAAGNGGDGSSSMRRERSVPFGGPDGGDGGRGGHIYALADRNINTLMDYRYAKKHLAKSGENGTGSDCYGAAAKDIVLRMPVGTLIYDADTGCLITDLNVDQQKVRLAKGGDGGFGNIHFKSSTNRAPRKKTNGYPGERFLLNLELKLLADIGLLGMPNAGKSTFITKISNARPKIADYPFTTLHPHLGVVRIEKEKSFVVADIPGLIAGAAEGIGLGLQFLRHLQRTKLLLHFIDVTPFDDANDPVAQALIIIEELKKYDHIQLAQSAQSAQSVELIQSLGSAQTTGVFSIQPSIYEKPRWIVLNKIDLIPEQERKAKLNELKARLRLSLGENVCSKIYEISAITGDGCKALCFAIQNYLDELKQSANLHSTIQ